MQINIIAGVKKLFSKKEQPTPQPTAFYDNTGYGTNSRVYNAPYTGENSLGEMGPIVKYTVDHDALAMRSWQLYLESGNYKTIIKKLKDSVIGSGLSLQSNPNKKYLEKKGITINVEEYNSDVESIWSLYANSTMSDYADKDSLGEKHATAYLNSIAAGCVLVILRPINNVVKVQLVDGVYLQTPISFGFAIESKIDYAGIERINPATGNRVRWGIEIDETGKHVAYHVRVGMGLDYVRVAARGAKSGALMAYILTDEEFRIDNEKGLPRMAAGMESASQLNRYQSAMVSAAEEIAKAPYYIFHKENTSDEDPRLGNITKAFDVDRPISTQLNYSAEGKAIANTVTASTNRTVINGTPGMELRALDSKNSLHYEPFNTALTEQQASLAGMSPEIVANKFASNFSASRAAFLAEGMRLAREWNYQGNHFLQPIFNLQLDIWVQTFEITAPGYLEALQKKNMYILNSYRCCIWEGTKMGHIDPLKEANYWRVVLGTSGAHLPMGTQEQATKALGNGDSVANTIQLAREEDEADKLKIPREDLLTERDENEEDNEPDGEEPPPKKTTKK